MANTLPSPTKVSGKFNAIYEAYYKQLDPKGLGTIEAMVAAKFLKKSGLSDVVLSRIWDLSDPTGRGFLDKEGLFVSLKLVALAQSGRDINLRNIFEEPPNPPKVGEIPKIQPPKIVTVLPHTQDWSIAAPDRTKYMSLFESLHPVDGLLPGNKVRSVLMDSKLPLDALSRIWDLADQDKDGSLDRHEFLVAMHLVYMALDKKTIPASLPVELQRPKASVAGAAAAAADNGFVANFPTDIAAPPPVPPLPSHAAPLATASHIPPLIPPMPMRPSPIHMMQSQQQPLIPTSDLLIQTQQPQLAGDWVVSPVDKQRFDALFKRSDLDNDGLVSGLEIKDVFLQSGIPQLCLAQIWALCDTAQSGKLTAEQFALAMWMVERKRLGYEPPECLAPNMVPPSQRASSNIGGGGGSGAADLVGLEANLMQAATPPEPAYANPELAMIAKEIEDLVRERRQLETEVTQREADIRIKNGEVRSLQTELDTLAATLKQLENQKGEAQKRLDDLKAQTSEYEREREMLVEQLHLANEQVNKIRDKCQKQEETIHDMEGEVESKRGELQKLKDEETSLEREYENNKRELDNVSHSLQDTKLQISQIKSMVTQLQESQRQMSDALAVCKSAIETNNPSVVSDYTLKLEPEFREIRRALEKKDEKPADDATAHKSNNGFTPADPFGSEAARTAASGFVHDFSTPSAGSAGFDDSFGSAFGGQQAASHDGGGTAVAASSLSADPFGDKSGAKAVTPDPNKDDFGSDPFAILHAPTSASQILSPGGHGKSSSAGPPPRPESPSPALPPKKAKQPPPRPAPPRPTMGPTPTRPDPPSHGFGAATTGAGGFADFANFDDITSMTPPLPLQPQPTTKSTTSTINTIITNATPNQTIKTISTTANATAMNSINTTAAIPMANFATAFGDIPPQSTSQPPIAATPTADFVSDPFKDYRYEDPFDIKDPFDDDDDAITDNFSSIIAVPSSPAPLPPSSSTATSATPTGGALPKVPAIAAAPAKAMSPAFAHFNNQFDTPAASQTRSTADFFDAFHDNFNNTNTTPAAAEPAASNQANNNNHSEANNGASASFNNLDNAFGSFDPFGVPTAAATTAASVADPFGAFPTKASSNAFATDFNNDIFTNAFEDEFTKVKVPNANANGGGLQSANNNNNTPTIMNQLLSSASSSSNISSDFAKFDAFNDGNKSTAAAAASSHTNGKNGFASKSPMPDPFGDDEDFGAVAMGHAPTTTGRKVDNYAAAFAKSSGATKKNNNNELAASAAASGEAGASNALKNPRYASDYSQGDAFDKDLQEALQRSMVDQ